MLHLYIVTMKQKYWIKYLMVVKQGLFVEH